ncbi:hypothetical protein [Methanosarcina sp. UBA5]|uniref:hypothetical protein n=1 Tax=Methanosarcina sp. UBA5 TaxID=1915593 RepID=UPI0025ECEDD7|nr:hypothetical protein [Methanosarcina sp. UBA5]
MSLQKEEDTPDTEKSVSYECSLIFDHEAYRACRMSKCGNDFVQVWKWLLYGMYFPRSYSFLTHYIRIDRLIF